MRHQLLLTSLVFGVLTTTNACKKKEDTGPARDKFIGTWQGSYTNNPGVNQKLIFTADPNSNGLLTTTSIGYGSCARDIPLLVRVSGNAIYADVKTFQDDCLYYYNIGASGTLDGKTLTWKQTSFRGVNSITTFKGEK